MANPPPFVALITRQLELWAEKREALQTQIDEIDRKIANAAKSVGLDPAEFEGQINLAPLPIRPVDGRTEGTMTQAILDRLQASDKGLTRIELRNLVAATSEEFGRRIKHNPNPFYNAVKRLLDREHIVDLAGVLYDARRAPKVDQGGNGLPFPPNVTQLKTATDQ